MVSQHDRAHIERSAGAERERAAPRVREESRRWALQPLERPAGRRAGRVVVCALTLLLAGCAGRLSQVPESQPHGVVTFRIVHPDADMAYQDHVVLGDQRPMQVRREVSIRLSPGRHLVTLLSDAEAYQVQLATVTHALGYCIDPGCTRFAPRREERYALVPQGGHSCSQTLELSVTPGQKSLALLIAGQGPGCKACERAELSARSCP